MQSENVSRVSLLEEILGYRVRTELMAEASFDGARNSAGWLVQVSPEHLRMRLSSSESPRLGQSASVKLGLGESWGMPLAAEVTDVLACGMGTSELGLRLVEPPLEAVRKLVFALEALRDGGHLLNPEARPVWKERILQQDRILRICDALVSRRCRGVARAEDGTRIEVKAALLDRYGKRIGWEFQGEVPQAPFALEAFGYSSVLTFNVAEIEESGGLVMVPLPSELVRFRHRWLRRAPVSSECVLRFTHPLWPEVQAQRPVLDISYEGLSCFTEPGEDLLYPGMKLPEIQVEMPGRAPVALRAEVRNISSTPKGRRCGLWVSPSTTDEVRRWRQLVEEQMHPNTRVAGEWNEASWELFERSGYFHLSGKEPSKFEALKAQWFDTQERLETTPQLGYRVVRPMDRGSREVEASFSVLKPYAGAWLGHQLARQKPGGEKAIPRSARHALRDTYLRCYEPVQLETDVKWLITYYEAHVRWTRFTQFDFVSWYEHTGKACLFPFRLMEGDTVPAHWPAPPAGYTFAEPTAEERALLLERVRQTRPEAYREALDLVPERLDLASIRRDWAQAKLSRERELRVARRDGKPVAMAVLEAAQPGLNLFNVLDGVRLFCLAGEESSEEVQDAFYALLGEAAAWYRARDRQVFIHYMETEHPLYAERATLADLGEGKLWIVSASLLPEYIEHLCEATTPRSDS